MRFLGKKEITFAWYTNVFSYVAKTGKKVHFKGKKSKKYTIEGKKSKKYTAFALRLPIEMGDKRVAF